MNEKSDTKLSRVPRLKPVPVPSVDESESHSLALPDVSLKEIPPSPDYQKTLEKALSTSRVQTPLPNLFNPLFRKQGPVNTLLIDALNQVGGFVKTLAEEIQTRDKVIEKLVEHTNRSARRHDSQISAVSQNLGGLFDYLEQLGHSLEGSSSKLSEMARETSVRFSGFLSSMKAADARTTELEEITLKDLPQLRSTLECHKKDLEKIHSDLDRQSESIQQGEGTVHDLSESIESRINGLATDLNEVIARTTGSLEKRLADRDAESEAKLAARDAEADANQAERATELEGLRKQIAALVEDLREEKEKRAADREEIVRLDARLTGLSEQVDGGFRKVNETTLGLGDSLEKSFAPLKEMQRTLQATIRGAVENADLARDEARKGLLQVEELAELTAQRLEEFDRDTRGQGEKLLEVLSRENAILNETRQAEDRLKQDLEKLSEGFASIGRRIEEEVMASRRVQDLDEDVDRLKTDLDLQKATVLTVLGDWEAAFRKVSAGKSGNSPSAKAVAILNRNRKKILDSFYRDFEARFRGSQEDIIRKQAVHLPLLQMSLQKTGREKGEFPILDLGCGRGEWLQHLRHQGFPAEGIDTNKVFLAICRRQRLKVRDDDALHALRIREDATLGAISAFHLIEHLAWEDWLELITQAYRVLIPGGLILLETPNPQNLIVGSCNFYMDPTHRNPLPPMTIGFALEHAGFVDVRTDGLNPFEPEVRISPEESEVDRRFNQFMYGARDYVGVGWKPEGSKVRI